MARGSSRQVLERALRAVARLGPPRHTAFVALRTWQGGHTRFAQNEVTQAAELERAELTVTVGLGARRASASSNQLDAAAIEEVCARAARLVRLAPEDPEALPPLGAQRYARATPGDAAMARAGAPERAGAVAHAIQRARTAGVQLAGFFEHAQVSISLATSAGLRAYHEGTEGKYACSARTQDGTGSGWSGASSHRLAELEPERHADEAIARALRAAKPRRLEPGRYSVVLAPAASAALLRFVTDALDARPADEGRSFYARVGGGARLGERLFPKEITVRSDPADAAADGRPFDDEGVPLSATTWIDHGELRALPYDRAWAHKQNRAATGAPRGLSISGGAASLEELVRGVERGLLISRFFYSGLVDPQRLVVTGLTRDGVFLIERGAIVGPVNNFRYNQSAAETLARCDGLGASEVVAIDGGTRLRAPLLRSHDFQVTSVSEAV